jgi:hypothetical protein
MRDAWWLVSVGAVVGALAVLVVVWRRRRGQRPPLAAGLRRPQPREIWWADVPFEDGTGTKVRPCLVLRTGPRAIEVLKITSQDQRDRRDHVEIPTRSWDKHATHNSFLDLSDPYRLRDAAFTRKAGVLDERTWALVRRVHSDRVS